MHHFQSCRLSPRLGSHVQRADNKCKKHEKNPTQSKVTIIIVVFYEWINISNSSQAKDPKNNIFEDYGDMTKPKKHETWLYFFELVSKGAPKKGTKNYLIHAKESYLIHAKYDYTNWIPFAKQKKGTKKVIRSTQNKNTRIESLCLFDIEREIKASNVHSGICLNTA